VTFRKEIIMVPLSHTRIATMHRNCRICKMLCKNNWSYLLFLRKVVLPYNIHSVWRNNLQVVKTQLWRFTTCQHHINPRHNWHLWHIKYSSVRKSLMSTSYLNLIRTTCFMECYDLLTLYGPFCHGALKLDISTLFTTFFLWTSL